VQQALVRRVLAHLEARTTDTGAGPHAQPVASYIDPVQYARESHTLFGELPLAIGHSSQLANPGDFITHDWSGSPLLVVRHDDGTLAASLNVCRHRGTRVEEAKCGGKKAFVCPYHAWTYGRDGALLSIPHRDGFPNVSERGLARVPVAEDAGLVIIRPRPDWLGSIADELAGFGTTTAHVYDPRTVTKELSWKLAIDIFLETYHLRMAHRDSIYRLFFDNVGLVDPLGPHLRTVFPKRTIRELADQSPATWQVRAHANVLYHLFPNTLALVQPDHVSMFHAWPLGPARTLIHSYTLVPEVPTTDKARRHWDANNAILYAATDEDFALGESIQRGLGSGANREVLFGAYEHALTHFHAQISRLGTCA